MTSPDVRDFTSYSERVEPSEAVRLLNRLFDVVVPVLQAHGGHANHYLGDGLLAVFGAPKPVDEHANAAVAAATEMQRRVRDVFGTEIRPGMRIGWNVCVRDDCRAARHMAALRMPSRRSARGLTDVTWRPWARIRSMRFWASTWSPPRWLPLALTSMRSVRRT